MSLVPARLKKHTLGNWWARLVELESWGYRSPYCNPNRLMYHSDTPGCGDKHDTKTQISSEHLTVAGNTFVFPIVLGLPHDRPLSYRFPMNI